MSKSIIPALCGLGALLFLAIGTKGQWRDQSKLKDWVWDHRQEIAEACLPVSLLDPADFPDDVKWLVRIRITTADIEWYAQFEEARQDLLILRFVVLKDSLTDRMHELKKMDPELQPNEIARLLSAQIIQHRELNNQSCQELTALAESLKNLKASPVLTDALMVDATIYEFTSQWRFNSLQMTYLGPGRDAPEQPHPIIAWTEALRTAAESCSP